LHYQQAWHGGKRDLFKTARERGLATSMDPQFPLFALEHPWIVELEDVLPYVDLCSAMKPKRGTSPASRLSARRRPNHDQLVSTRLGPPDLAWAT
jgi:hypothetical protein